MQFAQTPMGVDGNGRLFEGASNIHFVGPRLHSNMAGWIECLQQAAVSLAFTSIRQSTWTSRQSLDEAKIPMSRIGKILYPGLVDDGSYAYLRYFMPSLRFMIRRFWRSKGTLLVVRDRVLTSRLSYFFFRLFGGRQAFLYVQETGNPSTAPHEVRFLIKRLIRRLVDMILPLPRSVFTPIWDKKTEEAETFRVIPFLLPSVFFAHENRQSLSQRPGVVSILVVGKFLPYKQLGRAVASIAIASSSLDQKPNVTFLGQYAGEESREYLAKLRKAAGELLSDHNLSFVACAEFQDMVSHYQDADVVYLPNVAEVASIAVLEAAATGAAVIAPRENGTSCYLDTTPSGLYSATRGPSDIDLLSKALNFPGFINELARVQNAKVRLLCNCSSLGKPVRGCD